ncbi:SPOR domain-containing protein [Kamptonema formosum]|uniref:SPOR domain-containing protein n=1 Tax=Kamptonema formosum TaxID=331992 RepID=UPI000364728B|nr:SPOR domain-containing protein [Oscillatoria sp. PCC 10802]
MSERLSVESSTPSKPESLKPALQAALSSLDVKLEEELSRYRRQRRSEKSLSSYREMGRLPRQPLDLIYVTATGGRTNPEAASPPQQQPQPSPEALSPPSEPALLTFAPKPEEADTAAGRSAGAGGTDLTPAATAAAGESVAVAETNSAADDYLESSEVLLKSLAEEHPPKQAERSPAESLLNPLGIGSMLLFLMASATLGYVVTHPNGSNNVASNRQPAKQTPAAAPNPASTGPEASSGAPTPDLASREFVDLNLGSLSTLTPKPAPVATPQALPSPQQRSLPQVTLPPQESAPPPAADKGLENLSAALLPGSNQAEPAAPATGQPLPAPVVPAQTAPSAAAPPPAAEPYVPVEGDYYFVVTDYTDPTSLEKAQQVVADAYLRDFPAGVRIQLGAFNDAATAKTLVEQLQRQGLSAKVYRP